MSNGVTYAGIAIAACLIGFSLYVAFKYRGNDEKFNVDKERTMRIWRVLQICGVAIIVVLGVMQISGSR